MEFATHYCHSLRHVLWKLLIFFLNGDVAYFFSFVFFSCICCVFLQEVTDDPPLGSRNMELSMLQKGYLWSLIWIAHFKYKSSYSSQQFCVNVVQGYAQIFYFQNTLSLLTDEVSLYVHNRVVSKHNQKLVNCYRPGEPYFNRTGFNLETEPLTPSDKRDEVCSVKFFHVKCIVVIFWTGIQWWCYTIIEINRLTCSSLVSLPFCTHYRSIVSFICLIPCTVSLSINNIRTKRHLLLKSTSYYIFLQVSYNFVGYLNYCQNFVSLNVEGFLFNHGSSICLKHCRTIQCNTETAKMRNFASNHHIAKTSVGICTSFLSRQVDASLQGWCHRHLENHSQEILFDKVPMQRWSYLSGCMDQSQKVPETVTHFGVNCFFFGMFAIPFRIGVWN